MEVIGENIKKRRKELRLTQEELANKLGYKSRTTIAKIEAGENELNQTKLASFAKVLNTTPSYLIGLNETKNNNTNSLKTKTNTEMLENLSKVILNNMNNSNISQLKNTDEFQDILNSLLETITTTFFDVNDESFNAFVTFLDKSFNKNMSISLNNLMNLYNLVLNYTEFHLKKILDKESD